MDRDAAHLLTSELASNAVRHGKAPIDLSISVGEEGLRVSVFDRGAGFDPEELGGDEALSTGDWAEGGRGLQLVNRLSTEWGVDRHENGTEVWFRLWR